MLDKYLLALVALTVCSFLLAPPIVAYVTCSVWFRSLKMDDISAVDEQNKKETVKNLKALG